MRGSVSLGTGFKLITQIFPAVDQQLNAWSLRAIGAHPGIREQALASINSKRFHCLGGSVFALWPGTTRTQQDGLVRLIVAYQTISDYLDNLCDRMGVTDAESFRRLHNSMLAALDPGVEPGGCYDLFPVREDGEYLHRLVRRCRQETDLLPSFDAVREEAIRLASLYIDLQVHKHAFGTERVRRLRSWYAENKDQVPESYWWEFAAASGSTLGVFCLFGLATETGVTKVDTEKYIGAYFPYICGLHILLDYFIDQQEDLENNDLNLVSYYRGSECRERMLKFVRGAVLMSKTLPRREFHYTVVLGLLSFYLSDPKAFGDIRQEAALILREGGPMVRLMSGICKRLRRSGGLS